MREAGAYPLDFDLLVLAVILSLHLDLQGYEDAIIRGCHSAYGHQAPGFVELSLEVDKSKAQEAATAKAHTMRFSSRQMRQWEGRGTVRAMHLLLLNEAELLDVELLLCDA